MRFFFLVHSLLSSILFRSEPYALTAGMEAFELLTWLVVPGAALLGPVIFSAAGWQLGE